MRSLAIFSVLLGLVGPASGQTPSSSAASSPVEEKKVCRVEEPTGSHLPRRTCHTVTEWRTLEDHYHENVERLNDQRTLREMTPKP